MLIVVARDQAGFYEFLKPRQERDGRARVFLERRLDDRRRSSSNGRVPERRTAERRAPIPDAARALNSVLGFMILHPEETSGPA